jgi:hypothetical protein
MVETIAGVKYTNKYKDGVTYTDAAPVIRYAEVVLNMAEAQARNNSICVNIVEYSKRQGISKST